MMKNILACDRRPYRGTTRDAVIGAAVMIAASLIFATIGVALRRAGLIPQVDDEHALGVRRRHHARAEAAPALVSQLHRHAREGLK